MRQCLQPQGRARGALGRPRDRNRVGDRKSIAVAARRRRSLSPRGQKSAGLWANLMRILLTGTSGQVGGALRPLLQGRGEVLTPQRAHFDLAKPETLAEALDGLKPDLIINPAAY